MNALVRWKNELREAAPLRRTHGFFHACEPKRSGSKFFKLQQDLPGCDQQEHPDGFSSCRGI